MESSCSAADGRSLQIGVRTELGKALVRQFGPDGEFWDNRQCVVERRAVGNGSCRRLPGTTNETLVNGRRSPAPHALRDGDLIAVGRQAKGVIKMPLTARGRWMNRRATARSRAIAARVRRRSHATVDSGDCCRSAYGTSTGKRFAAVDAGHTRRMQVVEHGSVARSAGGPGMLFDSDRATPPIVRSGRRHR